MPARILKTCLGKQDVFVRDMLVELISNYNLYKKKHKIDVFSDSEINAFQYLVDVYDTGSSQTPSIQMFLEKFGVPDSIFNGVVELDMSGLRPYIYSAIKQRFLKAVDVEQQKMLVGQKAILTDANMQRLNELHRAVSAFSERDIDIDFDFIKIYEEKMTKGRGLSTGIAELDKILGGMGSGTLSTIAAFTSHFKSTFGFNILYHNCYNLGYNLVYFSMETSKEELVFNLMCRHSLDSKFTKYNFISHSKIRNTELTDEEKDYLYNTVWPDFQQTCKGKLIILDSSDFKSNSHIEIYNTLDQINTKLENVGGLDGFIVDYIQLYKFDGSNNDTNSVINGYVSFFRQLTQSFLDGPKNKKLIGVLLSQINRESRKHADRNGGMYDTSCLADANEIERGSHRIITIYTNDEMRLAKEATIQVIKNRHGPVVFTPMSVLADGESYNFGEEITGFSMPMGGDSGVSLADAFSSVSLEGFI